MVCPCRECWVKAVKSVQLRRGMSLFGEVCRSGHRELKHGVSRQDSVRRSSRDKDRNGKATYVGVWRDLAVGVGSVQVRFGTVWMGEAWRSWFGDSWLGPAGFGLAVRVG